MHIKNKIKHLDDNKKNRMILSLYSAYNDYMEEGIFNMSDEKISEAIKKIEKVIIEKDNYYFLNNEKKIITEFLDSFYNIKIIKDKEDIDNIIIFILQDINEKKDMFFGFYYVKDSQTFYEVTTNFKIAFEEKDIFQDGNMFYVAEVSFEEKNCFSVDESFDKESLVNFLDLEMKTLDYIIDTSLNFLNLKLKNLILKRY